LPGFGVPETSRIIASTAQRAIYEGVMRPSIKRSRDDLFLIDVPDDLFGELLLEPDLFLIVHLVLGHGVLP
ncbi:MAG TPA: hypothetical protein VMC61_03970, partial [Methanocella sp.]|nr:hypothetical protein [Methanocella sp.]